MPLPEQIVIAVRSGVKQNSVVSVQKRTRLISLKIEIISIVQYREYFRETSGL